MYIDLKIHVKNKLDNYLYIRCIHVFELFSYMSCSCTCINMYICLTRIEVLSISISFKAVSSSTI